MDLVSSAFAQGVKGAGVNGDKDSDDSSEDDNGDSEDDNGDSDSDDDDDSDSNDDESDAGDEDPSKNDSSGETTCRSLMHMILTQHPTLYIHLCS